MTKLFGTVLTYHPKPLGRQKSGTHGQMERQNFWGAKYLLQASQPRGLSGNEATSSNSLMQIPTRSPGRPEFQSQVHNAKLSDQRG